MLYEQPLNEQVRLCLRLEYLFAQTKYHLAKESNWDSHQTLKLILEILQAIDRHDLKNRFCQTLNQFATTLSQLAKQDGVDKEKLANTLEKIDALIDTLHSNSKKIGHELRDNEFLNSIQQRLYTPGGTCGFSLPAYHLWLQQEKNLRHQQLTTWCDHFTQLQETINLILLLLRETTTFKTTQAPKGFYQSSLDANISYQLIRINIPSPKSIFPEISIGRYRLAIHFFNLDITGQTTQTLDDITFELACCKM